jgi:hypothetical protein
VNKIIAPFYIFFVAMLPIFSFQNIVLGLHGLNRFGLGSRGALWWWNLIVAGLYGGYVTHELTSGGGVLPSRYGALSLGIGLLGAGAFLLIARSRWRDPRPWPTEPPRTTGLFMGLCLLEFMATGGQYLSGGVLVGVAFTVYALILRYLDRMSMRKSREH